MVNPHFYNNASDVIDAFIVYMFVMLA